MDTMSIKARKPFSGLFPVEEPILNAVTEDMKKNGFDLNFPVIVWKEEKVLIDGHTRLRAAMAANINSIPVCHKSFGNQDEAIQYAIHCQRDRRNMTDADLIRCIEVVDKRKVSGGDRKSEDFQKSKTSSEVFDSKPESSAEQTAKIVGTSKSKVDKARTILDHADDETKRQVKGKEKSIHKAYTETQAKRRQAKELVYYTGSQQDEEDPKKIIYQLAGRYQIIESQDGKVRWRGLDGGGSIYSIGEGPCWIEGRVLVLLTCNKRKYVENNEGIKSFHAHLKTFPEWDKTIYYTQRLFLDLCNLRKGEIIK